MAQRMILHSARASLAVHSVSAVRLMQSALSGGRACARVAFNHHQRGIMPPLTRFYNGVRAAAAQTQRRMCAPTARVEAEC